MIGKMDCTTAVLIGQTYPGIAQPCWSQAHRKVTRVHQAPVQGNIVSLKCSVDKSCQGIPVGPRGLQLNCGDVVGTA